MINKFLAIPLLCRWQNCFLAGFAVWVGAHTSGYLTLDSRILYACISAMLITAAGNICNDIADYKIDRQFKSYRPLAGGIITKPEAWVLASAMFAAGIVLSIIAGTPHNIIAPAASILLFGYNFYFKRIPVAGNIMVALLSGLPFLYGGLLSAVWQWSLIPFTFAVLMHLGREILKSMEDLEGDLSHNVRTIAAYIPPGTLKIVVTVLFTAVIILSVIPYRAGWYNGIYFTVLLIGIFVPMGILLGLLFKKNWQNNFPLIHQLLKIEMLAGTIAVLLGK